MKSCPTCKRTFEDDTLTYCLDDGTPLSGEAERASTTEEPIATPSAQTQSGRDLATTDYGQLPGKATVSATQSQIPNLPQYLAAPPPRRTWPWVVAGLVGLFLIVGVIAAVIIIPAMMRNSNNTNGSSVAASSPSPSDQSSPAAESTANQTTSAPTDERLVLQQLTELEKRWTEANISGDKDTLEEILAEDYSSNNAPKTKSEYMDLLKPDASVKSWEMQDLRVRLDGEHATLDGYLRQETTRGTEVFGFTDTFVWRDGRWQANGSRASRVK
jgi:Domain of unknown function (DUF4440)